jgi:predicted class III extradiol MEMO1 family dioxygenase
MEKVETLSAQKDLEAFLAEHGATFQNPFIYYDYARGASTDLRPREERYKVLSKELLG